MSDDERAVVTEPAPVSEADAVRARGAIAPDRRVIHRGIVVTHGVGSQRRVDQLDDVVEPLVTFLNRAVGHDRVHLKARTQVDERTASVQILLDPQDGDAEEWHVREAWWAETFRPSASTTILAWAVGAGVFHSIATARLVFMRNLGRLTMRGPAVQGVGVWQVNPAGKVRALFDAVIWLAITLGYAAVYLIGLILILPLYVILLLPFGVLFPAGVNRLQRGLVNTLTGGIGDQHATTNREVAVAGAADTVVTALWYFLGPNRPHGIDYETVTLVAHSGGCVVSFDALSHPDIASWLRKLKTPRRITWITVGSGLNLAYRMRARNKARDVAFWDRNLRDTVNWIDIYARYDPVPQGAAPEAMVREIVGPDPGCPYVSVRVANHDLPFTDHGAYWGNYEEAMSRIVHAISDSRLGAAPLVSDDGSYARRRGANGGEQDHPLATAVRCAVEEKAGPRRDVVTRNRFLSIVAAVSGVWLLLRWGPPFGAWTLGERDNPLGWNWIAGARRWLGDHVPPAIGPLDLAPHWPRLAGIVVLVLLAYALVLIARLLVHWWSWHQREPSFTAPECSPRRAQPEVSGDFAFGQQRR